MPVRSSPIAQLTLGAIPGAATSDRIGAVLRAKAIPRKPQRPMDIGLWSDDASQLDLIDMGMFQQPVED